MLQQHRSPMQNQNPTMDEPGKFRAKPGKTGGNPKHADSTHAYQPSWNTPSTPWGGGCTVPVWTLWSMRLRGQVGKGGGGGLVPF